MGFVKLPFNIDGRISLFTSLGFGVMALFLLYKVHPLVQSFVASIPSRTLLFTTWTMFAIVVIDFSNSIGVLTRLRLRTRQLVAVVGDATDQLDVQMKNLKNSSRAIYRQLERWQNYNIRQIKKAFPSAHTTRRHTK